MQPNTLIDTRTGRQIDLAMQSLEITGRVYPIGSFIRVIHRFRCLGSAPMEAIYVSQLPTGGVLRRFKIIGEDFEKVSKLEPRKKAREEYEEGIRQGHLSALAETNIDGMVNLSVGQVQPDEEVSIIMDVVVGVDTKDKGFRFRYPFTLAPNYHPQAKAHATQDGGSIELPAEVFGDLVLPEWKNTASGLHEVNFDILCYGAPLSTIASPSHRVAMAPQKDGSVRVTLAGMKDAPNRDLVIDVEAPESSPLLFLDESLAGVTVEDAPQVPKDAAKWTALMPSDGFERAGKTPKKVCFVLDRSGSMMGQRIEEARGALLACLTTLDPDDEFGIVHFGSDAQAFHRTVVKATKTHVARAVEWAKKIRCDGGTNMLQALSQATNVMGGPGDIFLITDGEVYQTGPIIEHMAESKSRVHVLGIGTASQHRFMAHLARRTHGVSDMVSSAENVGLAGLKLFNRVKYPVVVDTKAKVDGTKVKGLGTVWDGAPLLVNDPKGDGSLPGAVVVKGKGVKEATFSDFTQIAVPDGLTALLGAGRYIEDLSAKMDMARQGPQRDNVEKEMVDVSTAYQLASRVMSLVAVVERAGDQAGVTPEQKVVPVGMPEGQDPAGVFPAAGGPIANYAAPGVFTGQTLSRDRTKGVLRSASLRTRRSYSSASGQSLGISPQSVMCSADAESSTADTKGMYSPELSTRSLELNDHVRGLGFGDDIEDLDPVLMAAPAACAATSEEDDYDDGRFMPLNSIFATLATLEMDGGVRGNDLEERLLHTALFLLMVVMEAKKTPGVYDQHIQKMVLFLRDNLKQCKGHRLELMKAVKAAEKMSFKGRVTPGVFDEPANKGWETLKSLV